MLGQQVSYDRIPYFYTDQYDLSMEYSGYAGSGDYDRLVYRGDRRSRKFIAFWLTGGRVVAGMNVNVWDVTSDIEELIRSGNRSTPTGSPTPRSPLTQCRRTPRRPRP
jgi:3-phenylpropionate/trans-cinnamate dioxygenase ferredoxin reductase subunit